MMRLDLSSFTYPGENRPTLACIDLSVAPGECVLVAGGSGSGKSTLARILAGLLPGSHGGSLSARFQVGGESLLFSADASGAGAANPRINPAAWNRHIAYVGQVPSAQLSTVAATVAEEIAFALENAGLERSVMRRRVESTAAELGLSRLLDRKPTELSGGEQRRMILAAAAALHPSTLVLDEPTAGLDATARRAVEQVIAGLLARGAAVVLLSPELGGAGRLAGRVLLLEDGRMAGSGPRAEILRSGAAARLPVIADPREAREIGEGLPSAQAGPAVSGTAGSGTAVSGTAGPHFPAAHLTAVTYSYGAGRRRSGFHFRKAAGPQGEKVLDGVHLTLSAGERVAIAGANGAGKSTLLRHLNGLARPESGSVRILGRNIDGESVGSVAAAVAYLFQDPQDQLFERTVAREVGYGVSGQDPQHRDALVRTALERCGLSAVAEAHPYELPAAAQRLVALATVLVRQPAVLAMDEPTVAMDRNGLDRLAAAIRTESARGAAVAVVTHDLDFAYQHCQRLVLLSGGTVVADGTFGRVLDEYFTSDQAWGVEAPARWLRRRRAR